MFYYFNELLSDLSNTEVMVFSFIHAIYYRNLNENEERFFVCSNDYISERLKITQPTTSNIPISNSGTDCQSRSKI